MTTGEALNAYVEKFGAWPCLNQISDIEDEILTPLLLNAVKTDTPIDEKEGARIEHELWPDVFDADGGTKNGIVL
jgi:hypothetical protein